jgi:hypothetical protein
MGNFDTFRLQKLHQRICFFPTALIFLKANLCECCNHSGCVTNLFGLIPFEHKQRVCREFSADLANKQQINISKRNV